MANFFSIITKGCFLFRRNSVSRLGNVGVDDWTHVSIILKSQETCADHQSALSYWLEATKRLKSKNGIDKNLKTQLENEKSRWCTILERLMLITLFLSEHNLARGRCSYKKVCYVLQEFQKCLCNKHYKTF